MDIPNAADVRAAYEARERERVLQLQQNVSKAMAAGIAVSSSYIRVCDNASDVDIRVIKALVGPKGWKVEHSMDRETGNSTVFVLLG